MKTSPTTPSTTSPCRTPARPRAVRQRTLASSALLGDRPLPGRAPARRLPALPALGLRVGGARPGPAPGRDRPRRGARPRAPAGQLRLLDAPRRLRQEKPSTIEPLLARLDRYPTLRFKLDPSNDWDDELIAALVADRRGRLARPQGLLQRHAVDVETDPELYAKLIEAFPEAWLEDPDVTDETRPILEPVSERLTWDAPIHSIADIEATALVAAEDGQHQALAVRRPAATSSPPMTTARSAASAPTAAASTSSARAAARSSTSPRSSTRTPPTTSPPRLQRPRQGDQPGPPLQPAEPAI